VGNNRNNDGWFENTMEILKLTPVWVGPTVASALFIFLRWIVLLIVPAAKPGTLDGGTLPRLVSPMLAWVFGGGILMAWVCAEVHKFLIRRNFNSRSCVESLGQMSWQQFEHLVSEAYRRQGYVAQVVGSPSGDGGVDIELRRKGRFILVQCKQWKAYKVGVKPVRELLGVVVSRRADKGIIVTSGTFTAEARRFVEDNSRHLEAVDGPGLFELIRSVQKQSTAASAGAAVLPIPVSEQSNSSPNCPQCGVPMVPRVAHKGTDRASRFWGCPNFPGCRGTRPAQF
jgi:restriction system protein